MAKGGCACGAIRYELTADPMIVHACHCRDCQRITGGAFVVGGVAAIGGAMIPFAPITVAGHSGVFAHLVAAGVGVVLTTVGAALLYGLYWYFRLLVSAFRKVMRA